MPTYDYDCAACGRRFEVVHGVHAEGPTACPLCGLGPIRKAITAANVHYKGTGWAKKERRTTVASGASKSADGGAAGTDGGSKSDATASSEGDGSGSSVKTSESGAPESHTSAGSSGSSRSGTSKVTEKASPAGASKTSD